MSTKKNKKILVYAQQMYAPWIEGVKNNALFLCNGMKEDFDIQVLSHKNPSRGEKLDIIKGFSIHYILPLSRNKYIQIAGFFQSIFPVLSFTASYKPDIVLVQYLDTTYLLPLIVQKIFFPKITYVLHLYSTDELRIGYKRFFLRVFGFQKVIISSEYLREKIGDFGYKNRDIYTIPIAYDKSKYLAKSIEKKETKTILFSAGVEKDAGSYFMADVANNMPEFRFIFALRQFDEKSESQYMALEQYVGNKHINNISFLRNVSDMPQLLGKVSALVLPLQTEDIKMLVPVALLEAMASKTLCFVSSLPHLRKLVDNGKIAIIINEKDVAQTCKSLHENIEKRQDIIEDAFLFAQNYPNDSDILSSYRQILSSL